MASDRKKSLGLAVGLGLSAVSGGLAAWLTNVQLGNLLGTDGSVDLPRYEPPASTGLEGEPAVAGVPGAGLGSAGTGGSATSGLSGVGLGDGGDGEDFSGAGGGAAVSGFRRPPAISEFTSIRYRNIFNSEDVGKSDVVSVDTTSEGGDETEQVVSALGPLCVFVMHTLSTSPQQYSWSLVARDERGADQEIFRIGDEVFEEGSRLIRVGLRDLEIRRRDDSTVVFEVGKKCEAKNAPPATRVVAAADSDEKGGELGDGIQQVGDNKFVIPASELESAMGNLEQLAKDARVVPHYQNGAVVGFKVFRIKAGSVYSKLGLKNGDIIERVNGEDINSPERALALYQTLRNEKGFQLDLRRRNQPLTLNYDIQ